jgi:hypothetical protein
LMTVPDYYNRVNADLLRLMPPDAGVVLEAGCGAGALAEAYRRINPGVLYLGIEKNAEAARVAQYELVSHLDRLIGDFGLVQHLGENARRYVAKNRMLASHFRARHVWYHAMLHCKDELEAELYMRAPEIRGTAESTPRAGRNASFRKGGRASVLAIPCRRLGRSLSRDTKFRAK